MTSSNHPAVCSAQLTAGGKHRDGPRSATTDSWRCRCQQAEGPDAGLSGGFLMAEPHSSTQPRGMRLSRIPAFAASLSLAALAAVVTGCSNGEPPNALFVPAVRATASATVPPTPAATL